MLVISAWEQMRLSRTCSKIVYCMKSVQIYTEIFLVRIFLYSSEYRDLRSKSPESVQIQENTDQN